MSRSLLGARTGQDLFVFRWRLRLWTCAGLSVVSASLSLAPASDMLAIRAAGVLLVEVEMDQTLSETVAAALSSRPGWSRSTCMA